MRSHRTRQTLVEQAPKLSGSHALATGSSEGQPCRLHHRADILAQGYERILWNLFVVAAILTVLAIPSANVLCAAIGWTPVESLPPMQIRAEKPEDRAAVHELTRAAFEGDGEARLVDALRAAGDAIIALVGEDADGIAGHVLLSRLKAPENALALAPVSVAPDRQGKGVGTALINAALAEARRQDFAAIFVLGEPGYYTRFGFSLQAAQPYDTDYPKSHFMALELKPGGLAGRGNVVYAPAFGMVEL